MSRSGENLENLVRARLLAAEPTSAAEIARLLDGAAELLRDSRGAGLAAGSRFVLAYGAAHALALAALRAAGYRPSAAMGHRKVAFQVLATTAGAPKELWLALDRYHDRRNAAEYEAAPRATEAEAKDLVELAAKLERLVRERLKQAHPELLERRPPSSA